MASSIPNASHTSGTDRLRALLDGFTADSHSLVPALVQKAVYVARALQERAPELQTTQERRQQDELERIMLYLI